MKISFPVLFVAALATLTVACAPVAQQSIQGSDQSGIIGGEKVAEGSALQKSIVAIYDVKRNALCTGSLIRDNVIMNVPFPQPGFLRPVYPGFLQLSGFMSMNLDRHMIAQKDFFMHLVKNDGEPAEKHRDFYDEYLAVIDLTAEFYLQTVDTVFIRHALPKGEFMHREALVDPSAIRKVALLTVEGENDDISGVGQTQAAQTLCSNIPDDMRLHYLQPDVGHYGVFNGSRFRKEIAPRILAFAREHGITRKSAVKRVIKGGKSA